MLRVVCSDFYFQNTFILLDYLLRRKTRFCTLFGNRKLVYFSYLQTPVKTFSTSTNGNVNENEEIQNHKIESRVSSPQQHYPSSMKTNTKELDSDCMNHERIKPQHSYANEYNEMNDRYHPYSSNHYSPRHSYTEKRRYPSSVYERSTSLNQETYYDYDYHRAMHRSISTSPRHLSAFATKPSFTSSSNLSNHRVSPVGDGIVARPAPRSPDQHPNHLQVRRASTSVSNGYQQSHLHSPSSDLSIQQQY